MHFNFSAKHREKQEEFSRFANAEIKPTSGSYPWDNLHKAAGKGYLGLPIPRKWGGQEEDFLTYVLLIEEISRVCASTGVIMSVHTSVGSLPLLTYGSEAQKERYLPGLARGELLSAFALTETGAGSDAAALRSTATPTADGYVLNGCKLFITSGGEADLYTVFTTLDPARGSKGICAFLVEKGMPGLSFGPPERKMGLKDSCTTELRMEGLMVPAANRLGAEGEGFKIALSGLDGGRIGVAAQGLGLARAALEATVAHLSGPGQASGNISQSTRFTLADLFTRLEAARLLAYRAAWLKGEGRHCGREASMAKLFATDLAVETTTRCIDLWNSAVESAAENPLFRYFCDAKVTQIYEGSNQIQRIVVARELMREYR